MHHPILFTSPKRGGLMQSSGFLNLKSLIALSHTAKSNALDELSLVLLIENEMTRNHKVQTMEEAITFLKTVYRNPVRRTWLEGDHRHRFSTTTQTDSASITLTRDMILEAVRYDVMLTKMLRTIPESQRLQMVNQRDFYGSTLLHDAARSGNFASIKVLLDLYPQSQHWHVVSKKGSLGMTVLHHATFSGNCESVRFILALYPETEQRIQAVSVQDEHGRTALHYAARVGNIELIQLLLGSLPESERFQIVGMQDRSGRTVLHHASGFARTDPVGASKATKAVLDLLPESTHLQPQSIRDRNKNTPSVYEGSTWCSLQ